MRDLRDFNLAVTAKAIYDQDRSRWEFEENFKVLKYGQRSAELLLYTDNGNLSSNFSIFDYVTIEESEENRERLKHYKDIADYVDIQELDSLSCEKLLLEAIYYLTDIKDDADYLGDYMDLIDDIGLDYKRNYAEVYSTGYSQGDYATILVNKAEYKDVIGADFDAERSASYLSHLLWDCPIYLSLSLQFWQNLEDDFTKEFTYDFREESIYLDEFLDDPYNIESLNIEELIDHLSSKLLLNHEHFQQIRAALKNVEPEY